MFGFQLLSLGGTEDLIPDCSLFGVGPTYNDRLNLQVLTFTEEVVDLSHHFFLLLGAEQVLFLCFVGVLKDVLSYFEIELAFVLEGVELAAE